MFEDIIGGYAQQSEGYFNDSLTAADELSNFTIDTVLSGYDLPSIAEIEFFLQDSATTFDASVRPAREPGCFRIDITAGLVLTLREAFERFSCFDMGITIIDGELPAQAARMAIPRDLGERATYLTAEEPDMLRPSWWAIMSREQIEWAHYMSVLALWFIVNHEIAHVIRGHFPYLRQRGFHGKLTEFAFVDSKSIHFQQRFLEYDADTVSLDLMLSYVEDKFGELSRDNGETLSVVFQLYLAAVLVMMLLDRNTPSLEFHDKNTHPPLVARAASLSQTILDRFRDTDVELELAGAQIRHILSCCCGLSGHLDIPNGRWQRGRLLAREFGLGIEDRNRYIALVAELNEVADFKVRTI